MSHFLHPLESGCQIYEIEKLLPMTLIYVSRSILIEFEQTWSQTLS